MPELSIIICTMRRDTFLRELLGALVQQRSETGSIDFEIVVVDNDLAASARDAVTGFPGVRYVHEARAGVSYARNAGVAHAHADVVLFLDDDQLVGPTFVRDLIGGWHRRPTYQRGLRLRLEVAFEVGARPIAEQSRHLTNLASQDYAPVARGAFGTGGLIVERAVLCCDDEPFRPELGISGGEDTDFFLRASERGYHFGHLVSVAVTERVTADRARLPYQLARQFRSGQLDAALDLAAAERTRALRLEQALPDDERLALEAHRLHLEGVRDGWGTTAPPSRLAPYKPTIKRLLELRFPVRRFVGVLVRLPRVVARGRSATVLELQHLAYVSGRLVASMRRR